MSERRSENILLEEGRESLVVRFIRPEIRNPLSVDVLEELHLIVGRAVSNATLKKIMFTGTDDVFASGANLKEIAALPGDKVRAFALLGQTLMQKIAGAPQTTVAAVNGFCFGGAFDLALSCDIRMASPGAVFCHPGVGLGIMTGWSGTQRLPRLVGEAKALEFFLTAKKITAGEALQAGLIDGIYENLSEKIVEIAKN